MSETWWHWDEEGFVGLGEDPGESIAQVLRLELAQSPLSKKFVIDDQRQTPSLSRKPSVDRAAIVIDLNKDRLKKGRSCLTSELSMTSPVS